MTFASDAKWGRRADSCDLQYSWGKSGRPLLMFSNFRRNIKGVPSYFPRRRTSPVARDLVIKTCRAGSQGAKPAATEKRPELSATRSRKARTISGGFPLSHIRCGLALSRAAIEVPRIFYIIAEGNRSKSSSKSSNREFSHEMSLQPP